MCDSLAFAAGIIEALKVVADGLATDEQRAALIGRLEETASALCVEESMPMALAAELLAEALR